MNFTFKFAKKKCLPFFSSPSLLLFPSSFSVRLKNLTQFDRKLTGRKSSSQFKTFIKRLQLLNKIDFPADGTSFAECPAGLCA
jgi:hypothetical protein